MVAGATGDLEEALLAWRAVLGDQYVITDDARLAAANAATYATTQRAAGIIEPASVEDIQACLRIANQFHVSVYPISTGKNWGYGSRVPAQDGSVIMALHRMNGILELSEELAYVTVEPGVTMKQLYEFLIAKESRLMVPATGSAPTTSLIGNALERGLVVGPHSDRFGQTCGLEVVLPTGALVPRHELPGSLERLQADKRTSRYLSLGNEWRQDSASRQFASRLVTALRWSELAWHNHVVLSQSSLCSRTSQVAKTIFAALCGSDAFR